MYWRMNHHSSKPPFATPVDVRAIGRTSTEVKATPKSQESKPRSQSQKRAVPDDRSHQWPCGRTPSRWLRRRQRTAILAPRPEPIEIASSSPAREDMLECGEAWSCCAAAILSTDDRQLLNRQRRSGSYGLGGAVRWSIRGRSGLDTLMKVNLIALL